MRTMNHNSRLTATALAVLLLAVPAFSAESNPASAVEPMVTPIVGQPTAPPPEERAGQAEAALQGFYM